MKVLIVGSGGREHALAWKIAASKRLHRLYIAPGNPGTFSLGINLPISANDTAKLTEAAVNEKIDLVIIGPETPLAAGLADSLRQKGIAVFGPDKAAAQIESSKAFSKQFMQRHHIPTARFKVFGNYKEAAAYLRGCEEPIVIKASGLAAGKGVLLPEDKEEAMEMLYAVMVQRKFGDAGNEVVIEERLYGEEVSLMAFTDGVTVSPMIPVQDHKRLLDGDQGPNTGGMGAYAPVPACPPALAERITREVLQVAVDGLRKEGMPFVGVLYAGIILTSAGLRVLEFNCRFGDPETQVVLPLLKTDLLEIAKACTMGKLDQIKVEWEDGAAACVVIASEKYPAKPITGRVISGLETPLKNGVVFHAGTREVDGTILTDGGRVLGVTGWGKDLPAALQNAYAAAESIQFEGMHYRRDIGSRGMEKQEMKKPSAYRKAGVDIDAGKEAVEKISSVVQSTHSPQVLAGVGAFGGAFDASLLKTMRQPVLVSSIDGVGTKVKLAASLGRFEGLGMDIVNHCVNDILVQGAFPLFFLDYFASSRLQPDQLARVVAGMAQACREAGCALLGGETAEMPGVYAPGEFDVAGCITGVVEGGRLLPKTAALSEGDLLLGLRSSGPHTNGYSLIRSIINSVPLEEKIDELGCSLADALLAPHRSYLPLLKPLLEQEPSPIKALAHITGGGFMDNIPRVLPKNLSASINRSSWTIPPIFKYLQREGDVSTEEMFHVFNMGIGMVAVIAPGDLAAVQAGIGEETWVIGRLVSGDQKVILE